jgi:hypothetical protein
VEQPRGSASAVEAEGLGTELGVDSALVELLTELASVVVDAGWGWA